MVVFKRVKGECHVVLSYFLSFCSGKAIVTYLPSYVIQKKEIKHKTEMMVLEIPLQTKVVVLLKGSGRHLQLRSAVALSKAD